MDFLGSTTPADNIATVVGGVQESGAQIWPLLVFVGVPLAFVIYRMIAGAIKTSVGTKKTS